MSLRRQRSSVSSTSGKIREAPSRAKFVRRQETELLLLVTADHRSSPLDGHVLSTRGARAPAPRPSAPAMPTPHWVGIQGRT